MKFIGQPFYRQKTKECVGAAGNGNGDGENIINKKRASRDHAERGREQFACYQIATTPRREELDNLRVTGANDKNGDGRGDGHEDTQVDMFTERQKRLFRSVRRRREPVRTQSHPSKEGNEREIVEDGRVVRIDGAADNQVLESLDNRWLGWRNFHGPV